MRKGAYRFQERTAEPFGTVHRLIRESVFFGEVISFNVLAETFLCDLLIGSFDLLQHGPGVLSMLHDVQKIGRKLTRSAQEEWYPCGFASASSRTTQMKPTLNGGVLLKVKSCTAWRSVKPTRSPRFPPRQLRLAGGA